MDPQKSGSFAGATLKKKQMSLGRANDVANSN